MIDGLDPDDPVDARDTALVLIGYTAALCRRSDLARLDLDDLTITADGLEVRVRRSKTDQEGAGAVVGVAADQDGACPAGAATNQTRPQIRPDHAGPPTTPNCDERPQLPTRGPGWPKAGGWAARRPRAGRHTRAPGATTARRAT